MKEQINPSTNRRKILGIIGTGVALLGVGAASGLVAKRMLGKPKEQPRVRFLGPDKKEKGLIQETELTWVSKDARKFLDKNRKRIPFDGNTGELKVVKIRSTITRLPVDKGRIAEINVVLDKDKTTLGFYFLNKEGIVEEAATVYHKTGDDSFEYKDIPLR
ncbi:MAG: hypothetical protein Q7S75_02645 [bacterium]|nr:hypothetical protein [bacterium]